MSWKVSVDGKLYTASSLEELKQWRSQRRILDHDRVQPPHSNEWYSYDQVLVLSSTQTPVQVIDQWVVGPTPIVLPDYCSACGRIRDRNGHRFRKEMSWRPAWGHFTALLGPLGLVVSLAVPHASCDVTYTLCSDHVKRRRQLIGICTGLWVTFVIVSMIGVTRCSETFLWSSLLLLFAALVTLAELLHGVQIARFEDGKFFLRNICPRLLTIIKTSHQ